MTQVSKDTRWSPDADLVLRIVNEWSTPIYVVDERSFRQKIRDYKAAFSAFDEKTELTFASKANSTLAVLRIAHSEGCLIDTASEGELRAALLAGVPAKDCHMHGNNKSESEIRFAIEAGIGQIVADNLDELKFLATVSEEIEVILRLAPGVLPITNEKISTGQQDTKFGLSIYDGAAEQGVQFCLENGINLVGIHCHVGSQLVDPEAQIAAGRLMAEFARDMHERYGWVCKILNVGGGRGVRYIDEQAVSLDSYCQRLVEGVRGALAESDQNPVLVQEPGRSLIAESGVTIYRVGCIKDIELPDGGMRRYVVVDGGMADNPRPALYGAKYGLVAVAADGREFDDTLAVRVSGRHCETDLLFDNVELPTDLKAGDYLVVLTTGAYSSSMASNYNRYPRPATVLVRESGECELVQAQESFEVMFAREIIPENLK